MAYKTLNLDLAKSPILKPIVYGRIGDSDMQTVTVNITSRDVPVDLKGFIITFEGITNGEKTKVFDVSGINSTAEGLEKGTFDYTFPNMAFAVGGSYEIAYFSIVKGDKRDTTGEFDIIVASNADIDAAEAETIITEYNKLVQELNAITDQYISDSDAKFADINAQILNLQSQIAEYQANVEKTADDAVSAIDSSVSTAVSTVNSSSNAAIKAVEDALEIFEAGDFYTKLESDATFALKSDIIDAYSKTEADDKFALKTSLSAKANNSEVVHLTGDETIAGKKTFTGTLSVNKLEVSGDLPKGTLTPKTGFAISGSPWYRVKNGLLQISCTGLSITANVPAGAWKDVCSLTNGSSINSTGDATTVIMNGSNANYIGARVRVVNGVLRILPGAAVAPTQYLNDFITIAID